MNNQGLSRMRGSKTVHPHRRLEERPLPNRSASLPNWLSYRSDLMREPCRPADPPRTGPPLAYYPALIRKRGVLVDNLQTASLLPAMKSTVDVIVIYAKSVEKPDTLLAIL
jgi:hypothetical protein